MPPLLTRKEEAQALRLARSQPESAEQFNALLARLRSRVVDAVMDDGRVRERLAEVRHRVLAVDYREDKPDATDEPIRMAEVAVYDYDRDVLVVAVADLRRGELVDLYEREGAAPPVTDEELDEARNVLSDLPEFARALRRKTATVVAFPIPSYAFSARPERARHRGCTVYVAAARGDVLSATVDLSAREVVPDDELPEILRPGRTGRSGA